MNKIINWIFGSFFRTLGRFLVYILLGYFLSYLIKDIDLSKINIFQVLNVSAESISVSDTADGYVLIDGNTFNYNTLYVSANNDINFRIMTATALSESNNYSFMFADMCSPHDIWAYRTAGVGESCTNSCWSNQVLVQKTDYICSAGGYQGNIYRISTPIKKWEKDEADEMAYVSDRISIGTSQASTVPLTLYGVYFSTDSDLGKFETDYTQTINNINSSIANSGQSIIDSSYNNSQAEINNATQNKNDIINNQNSNSQAQIDNANANTDKTIDSQKVCSNIIISNKNIITNGKYLNYEGNIIDSNYWGLTDYLEIPDTIKIIKSYDGIASLCFYKNNKDLISCKRYDTLTLNSNISIPNNSSYVRYSINISQNLPQFETNKCKNGNQATNDTLNDMNNNLTNDNINEQGATDFVNGLDREYSSLTPFSDFVNLPLRWIQSLFSSQNSCEPIDLPLPYLNNKALTLPCMTEFWQRMGALGTLIQMVWIAIVGVRIFNGLFLLTCETLDPNPDKDMTKLRTWEL